MLSGCNSRSGAQRGYRGRLSKEHMLDILADMGPPSSYQWEKTDICIAHQWVQYLKEQEKQHPVDNNVAYWVKTIEKTTCLYWTGVFFFLLKNNIVNTLTKEHA